MPPEVGVLRWDALGRYETMPKTNLASELNGLEPRRGTFPWPDHEYVRGWGVFGLPFDSGHYLALRVFPENDFAPYRSVWHRDAGGTWSIFVDAPRLDIACPRYYGPAAAVNVRAGIELRWTGPMSLRVRIDAPALDWTVEATESPLLRLLNLISPRLPLWTWKRDSLLRARELMARRLLGVGPIRFKGRLPSGHVGTLMPQRMYFIESSSATLEGEDLGRPAHAAGPIDIGGVPVPCRGILAVGQAAVEILDPSEYRRTRAEVEGA
jgi:hypothetical protein